jgi:hypothetical protein
VNISRNLARRCGTERHPTGGGRCAVCHYMFTLSKRRELNAAWQEACRLILARADARAVTRQLSLALFMDANLDVRADLRCGRSRPSA